MPKFQSLDGSKGRSAAHRHPEATGETTPLRHAGEHPLLILQHLVGNAQIARMLAQRAVEEEDQVQAKHVNRIVAQRAGEDEEPVQAAHEGSVSAAPQIGPEGGDVSSELSAQINSQRGQGSALDDGTRAAMEGGFGTKFESVRVHTDAHSDALNRSISAKAFTTGSDIFFSRGSYQPSSGEGRTLLSHELAHVVQQRSMSSHGPMRVNPAGDSYEQQADVAAQSVTSSSQVAQRADEDEG